MVSVFCEVYHWPLDMVLKTNAVTFFALLKEASKSRLHRETKNYMELCMIAAIPACDHTYKAGLLDFYDSKISTIGLPERPKKIGMDPLDPFAVAFMTDSFAKYRGVIGG